MPSLRLIVLNYERPANVDKIISVYKELCPITVVNNNPNESFPYLGQPIEVINNEKNWLCMERWHRCFEYDEEFKLVIDDDLLPHPSLVKSMISKDLIVTGIYGKSGVGKTFLISEILKNFSSNEICHDILRSKNETIKFIDKVKVSFSHLFIDNIDTDFYGWNELVEHIKSGTKV